jgi:uncharacterized protein YkwD
MEVFMNQPQTMPESKPAMIRPWLLIIFIVVILAAAGYFGWYYFMGPGKATPATTSTTNPTTTSATSTADWKTYENKDYDFSFKLPSNITIKETIINIEPKNIKLDLIDQNVSITVYESNLSLADIKKISEQHGSVIVENSSSNFQIKDAQAVKYELGGISVGEEIDITNNKNAVLATVYANPGNTMSRETFEKILSTFQFTDSLTGAEASTTISHPRADEIINLTNQERVKAGLSPLQKNDLLTKTANDIINDMLANNYYDTKSPFGKTAGDFAINAGYKFCGIGENISFISNSSEEIVTVWMNVSETKPNITNPKFKDVGIAVSNETYKNTQNPIVVMISGYNDCRQVYPD